MTVDFASMAGLFLASFLAATLVPGSSEAALVYLVSKHPQSTTLLFLTALAGNTLGAVFNYVMGYGFMHLAGRKWFPASARWIARASQWFNRFGVWLLLFSWLPLIGDPLTVAAGMLRVRFALFLPLVALGKAARYLILLAGVKMWWG